MLVVGWLGCQGGPDGGSRPVEVVEGPILTSSPTAPLARELTIETDVPGTLSLRVLAEGVDLQVRFPTVSARHVVPVLGAPPGRSITVEATVSAPRRRPVTASATFDTPPLPDTFPTITVRRLDPDVLQAGVLWAPLQTPNGRHWLVAIDPRTGEIVWWYGGPEDFGDLDVTDRGTLIGLADGGFLEIDLLGRRAGRWLAASRPPEVGAVVVDAPGFTHELVETPEGFLTLSSRIREVDAYPRSYEDPETLGGPASILEQEVLTVARDGEVTARWSLADRLDVERIGFDSLDWVGAFDWSHANAVLPDPGGVIVSVRHQDALVALDPAGEVRWILSNPYGWSPEREALLLDGLPPDGWPLHQHGPSFDADGNLMWFDNGNEGHTPYSEPPGRALETRVTAVTIDEEARTARTAWIWKPPDTALYSPALGNVALLPGGHVLANYGFVSGEDGVDNLSAGRPTRSVRVFELDPSSAAPILDLAVDTDPDTAPEGVKAYRVLPAPSLYPPGVTVLNRSTP